MTHPTLVNSQPDHHEDPRIFVATITTDIDIVNLCCPYNFILYKNFWRKSWDLIIQSGRIEHNYRSFLEKISMEICRVKCLLSVVSLGQYWGHFFFIFFTYKSSNCKIKTNLIPDVLSIEISNTINVESHCTLT